MQAARPADERDREPRINAKSQEVCDLEGSINRAVLCLAIAAGAVIFDLIRKGADS